MLSVRLLSYPNDKDKEKNRIRDKERDERIVIVHNSVSGASQGNFK